MKKSNRLFKDFPKTKYNNLTITDFTRRVAFFDEIADDDDFCSDYYVQEGETPVSLAQDFYSDPYLFWVILYINNIIDPFFGWAMDYASLQEWIENEFDDPDEIIYVTYKGIRYENFGPDSHIQGELGVSSLEELLAVSGVLGVTRRMHEEILNDDKRFIRVVQPDRMREVLQQFRKELRDRR